ncbi:MAG: hypothetical protein DRP64_10880 [Verrucomicrobia bacterium]|nr:MAG: hypothetical protein DRP64_10880 [Verrucomicrobiota bacterium]RKZ10142.1 MAG: hypothetical protein DRQ32_07495 [bacterium]
MLNFNWLAGVSVESAKWMFLGIFTLIGVAVLLIPNKFITEGLTEIRWWHNLKIWAIGLLAFISVVYYIF